MAKRFSETNKWNDEWFTSLKPFEKLVFLFIVDRCDNAGFFEINARLNAFIIGVTETEYLTAIKGLGKGIEWSCNGKKIWVKNFLLHQKNIPLKEENNAHRQIIKIISETGNQFPEHITFFSPFLAPKKNNLGASFSPIGKGIGIGNNKEGDNFKNIVYEQFRMKLDRGKFSDYYINAVVDEFVAKYPNQNVNKLGPLIGTWAQGLKPDVTLKTANSFV